jgi:hypothetical protein
LAAEAGEDSLKTNVAVRSIPTRASEVNLLNFEVKENSVRIMRRA